MTTLSDTKPDLKVGETYSVRMYPLSTILDTSYLGKHERWHFFKGEEDYLMADDHWIRESDTGIITYLSLSSAPIHQVEKERVPEVSKKRPFGLNLQNILEEFGEEF